MSAKILGHPIHPMLVTFPIAFYTSTLIAFIIHAISGSMFWLRVAIVANIAGLGMALVAAAFGLMDWYGIPSNTPAKSTGIKHMALNSTGLIFFLVCLILNVGQWNAVAPAWRGGIILSLIGFLLTIGAGYYGYTMVQTHHVGVQYSSEEERCLRDIAGYGKRTA